MTDQQPGLHLTDGPGAPEGGGPESAVVEVQRRLRDILRPIGWAAAARQVGCNAERLRRQCTHPGAQPTLEVVIRICSAFDLNANWVLFGVPPQHGTDLRSQILSLTDGAPSGQLFAFVGTPLGPTGALAGGGAADADGSERPAEVRAIQLVVLPQAASQRLTPQVSFSDDHAGTVEAPGVGGP
ncbi:MAG: hypothetical protein IT431_18195 [Phycisphaerales bacterium]|nr:hypothetical protein [Phycisphaerales bacterium]